MLARERESSRHQLLVTAQCYGAYKTTAAPKIQWNVNTPRQQSVISAQATSAPALAPATFCATRWGAYSLQQLATPTWYMPRNPQPENDRCGTMVLVLSPSMSWAIEPVDDRDLTAGSIVWFKKSRRNRCWKRNLHNSVLHTTRSYLYNEYYNTLPITRPNKRAAEPPSVFVYVTHGTRCYYDLWWPVHTIIKSSPVTTRDFAVSRVLCDKAVVNKIKTLQYSQIQNDRSVNKYTKFRWLISYKHKNANKLPRKNREENLKEISAKVSR